MGELKTTNLLLLIIVVPLVFYLLHILSFIFIPLTFAMFIALLFLPMMRYLSKKNIPKFIAILLVLLIIGTIFKIGGTLIQLSSKEIMSAESHYFELAEEKLASLAHSAEAFFGVTLLSNGNLMTNVLNSDKLFQNFGSTVDFASRTLSMTLMTAFFVILLLAESIDFQKILHSTILKRRFSSVKTFLKIERDLITFIKVKFFISFLTGIATGLLCLFFDVSFPIFWGLFAFIVNFVQMIGSIACVILLSIFALAEIDQLSIWLLFSIGAVGLQIFFGSILEPILMGKSFSINIVSILVMLMLWGYVWGIPGMIMAIPITVFLKILFEQSPNTKVIAELLGGNEDPISSRLQRKRSRKR